MASSRAAIWMTFGAAAGTLVVAIGLVAGPSILRCSGSPDGVLSCLREQVVNAGLLPEPPAEASPVASVPAEVEPQPASAPPATPDVNLVRAEPDGGVIVAGTAAPGVEVEVFANGDLVGKVMAEASGDWVLVPDRPLAVGSATISVGAAGSNEQSPHTFTVIIPADKTSQPIITASQPDVAKPEPQAEPAPTVATEPMEPEPAPEVAPKPEPRVAASPEPKPQIAPVPASPAPVERAAPIEQAVVDEPPASPPVAAAPTPAEPPMQLAEAEPAKVPQTAPPVVPAPPPPATIDAIEIDGSANYFAGAGPEAATVNLYVQDKYIASATVEGGRWLVEARGALNLPMQRVRVDLIEPQQGDVSARAEVNFVIDVPPPAPPVEIAATATASATPAATATTELAVAPQAESELEATPAIPTLRALPSVDPLMLRFASGKAIIRRGETLWAIAERVYGDGSQYRHIVEANEELAASPGRIYPGQVFDLPKLEQSAPVN